MPQHAFHILDVFTNTPFAGNPLAVVHDADDLDLARCQSIAREFNLSETVFVLSPRDPVNTARVRIFTPARELPFAGHPTVGTAVLLALVRAPEMVGQRDLVLVLEEDIGDVECIVRRVKGAVRASFTLPRLPSPAGTPAPVENLAAALGLPADLIGIGDHRPVLYSAGVPFTFVPLGDLAAVRLAAPQLDRWSTLLTHPSARSMFVYTRGGEGSDAAFHARMFAPEFGITEDPATGGAVAAFAGVVTAFDRPADGDHTLLIEQGFEMGRPSRITLGLDIEKGVLRSASVGGEAVIVAEGTLR